MIFGSDKILDLEEILTDEDVTRRKYLVDLVTTYFSKIRGRETTDGQENKEIYEQKRRIENDFYSKLGDANTEIEKVPYLEFRYKYSAHHVCRQGGHAADQGECSHPCQRCRNWRKPVDEPHCHNSVKPHFHNRTRTHVC